jgi:hypothetical protein
MRRVGALLQNTVSVPLRASPQKRVVRVIEYQERDYAGRWNTNRYGVTLVSMCGLLNYCLQPLLIWQLRRREVDQLDFRSNTQSPQHRQPRTLGETQQSLSRVRSRTLYGDRDPSKRSYSRTRNLGGARACCINSG